MSGSKGYLLLLQRPVMRKTGQQPWIYVSSLQLKKCWDTAVLMRMSLRKLRKSLRKLIAAAGSEDFPDLEAIFHQGTTLSSCDFHMLTGVVRWYLAKQEQPAARYWQNKKLKTDILKVGDPFVRRLKWNQKNEKEAIAASSPDNELLEVPPPES